MDIDILMFETSPEKNLSIFLFCFWYEYGKFKSPKSCQKSFFFCFVLGMNMESSRVWEVPRKVWIPFIILNNSFPFLYNSSAGRKLKFREIASFDRQVQLSSFIPRTVHQDIYIYTYLYFSIVVYNWKRQLY